MTGIYHPALRIMSRRAAEAGIDIETINGDVQQRAVIALIVELLDMIAGDLLAHPEVLPTVGLALHSYAELIERSAEAIDETPAFRDLIKHGRQS